MRLFKVNPALERGSEPSVTFQTLDKEIANNAIKKVTLFEKNRIKFQQSAQNSSPQSEQITISRTPTPLSYHGASNFVLASFLCQHMPLNGKCRKSIWKQLTHLSIEDMPKNTVITNA